LQISNQKHFYGWKPELPGTHENNDAGASKSAFPRWSMGTMALCCSLIWVTTPEKNQLRSNGSHAPAWELNLDAPASNSTRHPPKTEHNRHHVSPKYCRQITKNISMAGNGNCPKLLKIMTLERRSLHSHAGAWERWHPAAPRELG